MKNLFKFEKSPVLNFFRRKPEKITLKFIPEEIDIINTLKVVKGNWDEKQDKDPSISDEYKKYQIVSKMIKIFPKHEKNRIHILYDLMCMGMIK